MKRSFFWIVLMLLSIHSAVAQCPAQNTAFKAGEILTYDLYFNWKFIWVKVGSASMDIANTRYNGKDAYRCHLITRGSKRADKFFVMRDTLVSIVDHSIVPYYFRKGALEGKQYRVDEVWYNYQNNYTMLRQLYKNPKNKINIQNKRSTECVYDMLSMLLKARSFNADGYKVGQKIKFLMADGDDVKMETLIYRGKKNFEMENTGITYRCLVFSFVEYKNKQEKEVITFYVTDDKNHLPVRLDMYLNFGSAKAFLNGFKGIRNPMTSIIKK